MRVCITVLFAIFLIGGCGGGSGGSDNSSPLLSLQWDPVTTNIDGTPCDDLAGYRLYYGQGSRDYTDFLEVDNQTTTVTLTLSGGHWCFAVTAFDTSGNESDYSNEVCTDI